jgi:hypothetical protein
MFGGDTNVARQVLHPNTLARTLTRDSARPRDRRMRGPLYRRSMLRLSHIQGQCTARYCGKHRAVRRIDRCYIARNLNTRPHGV